jgi:hypothetical protein
LTCEVGSKTEKEESSSTKQTLIFTLFACAYQSLSAFIQQCFSLTTNQHQPESGSQKPSSEQDDYMTYADQIK